MDWLTKSFVLAWILMALLLCVGVFFTTPFFNVVGKVFAIMNLPVVIAVIVGFIKDFKDKEE